jgi:hypothetical protein
MKMVNHFSKYLGMPTKVGRSKRQVFDFIQDRIWNKLKGWKEKQLSFAGRSTLIKAVAQVIPTYIMSCFLLPKNLCQHIESMTCKYWWGSSTDRRKIHWVKWSQICKNKKKGGLGFRSLKAFNEALLAKQGWQCITRPESLLSRVLKAKYYPKSDFLHAKHTQNMSYTWTSILKAGWILKKGGLWKIGDGKTINIWQDNWLPDQEGYKSWSVPNDRCTQKYVNDLILPISKTWNNRLIHQLFLPFEAKQITTLPIINTAYPDEFYWPKCKDGTYTVKSGYQAIQEWKNYKTDPSSSNLVEDNQIWETIWKQKIPPKHNHLIWRILQNALPVRSNLNTKGVNCNPLCPRCYSKIETIDHVFKECVWTQQVWFASQLSINFSNDKDKEFRDWLQDMFSQAKHNNIDRISTLCYHIWKARNMLIFQQKDIPVLTVVENANSNLLEYQKHRDKSRARSSTNNRDRSNELKWTPPPATALKTNVDAHCNGDGRWGLGWVVRNVEGVCLGAATSVVCARSAAEAEARGIEAVLRAIHQVEGFSNVIESDANEVVKAIQTKECPRVYWGSVVRNCIDMLDTLPNTSVIWGKRDGNKVAHQLARWAFKTPIRGWLTTLSPPHCISYPN